MNESLWRVSTEPAVMVDSLKRRPSVRLTLLWAVAYYHRLSSPLNIATPTAITEAELRADSESWSADTSPDMRLFLAILPEPELRLVSWFRSPDAVNAEDVPPLLLALAAARGFDLAAASGVIADCLREVLGCPLRPVVVSEAILNRDGGTVRHMAGEIYQEQAFNELPHLADAAYDAGCGDERLLSHLRSPGPHGRGCWALDRLRGVAAEPLMERKRRRRIGVVR
jgi:hypothetical protein